jgi:hypothetical protein
VQLHIATNRRKQVIFDSNLASHLKVFNMADLLESAVILFNHPVLVMQFAKGCAVKRVERFTVRQVDNSVAQLVF